MRGLAWWWTEFQAVLPSRLRNLILDPQTRYLTVRVADDLIEIAEGQQILQRFPQPPGHTPRSWSEILSIYRKGSSDVRIGIDIAPAEVFIRTLTIPVVARRSLPEILDQDLTHRLPFPKGAMIHSFSIENIEGAPDRLRVHHLIVKRLFVEKAANILGIPIEQVDFINAPFAEKKGHATILTRAAKISNRDRIKSVELVAAGMGLLFLISSVLLCFYRQSAELAKLDADIAAIRPIFLKSENKSRELQQYANALALLQRRKNLAGIIPIVNDLTKMLPDENWLQNIELVEVANGRQIEIMGYAQDAARLVGVLNRSNMFSGAFLSSTVAFDPVEKRERFTLNVFTKEVSLMERRKAD